MSAAAGHAYDFIRAKILEGAFPAGHRLKESELSALCDVSRTPVREALRRLAADGLVLITPNSGAVVAEWDEQDIADIYRVRIQLEVLAAELAAERRTEGQVEEMERLAQAIEGIVRQGADSESEAEIARLNSELHHLIIAAANSHALSAAVAQVIEAPLILRTFRKYDPARLQRSASDHLELVGAIRAHDGELAGSLMRAHILKGLRTLQNSL